MVGVLNVGEKGASTPNEVQASSKQIPGGAHLRRIDVGFGERAAAEQGGDLHGIDLVVLGFAAVDGLHVEGVAEHEVDAFVAAYVS